MIRILIALALLATSAMAQEVVGKGTVRTGEKVELLSDGTWRSVGAVPESGDCTRINDVLSFCAPETRWAPESTLGTDFIRSYQFSDRLYAGIIFEALGEADGIDAAVMREIVVTNVAAVTNVTEDEVPVFDMKDVQVDGIPAETIVYGGNFSGLPFIYFNTIVTSERHTIQLLTWSVDREPTSQHEERHAEFLDNVRLALPGRSE